MAKVMVRAASSGALPTAPKCVGTRNRRGGSGQGFGEQAHPHGEHHLGVVPSEPCRRPPTFMGVHRKASYSRSIDGQRCEPDLTREHPPGGGCADQCEGGGECERRPQAVAGRARWCGAAGVRRGDRDRGGHGQCRADALGGVEQSRGRAGVLVRSGAHGTHGGGGEDSGQGYSEHGAREQDRAEVRRLRAEHGGEPRERTTEQSQTAGERSSFSPAREGPGQDCPRGDGVHGRDRQDGEAGRDD